MTVALAADINSDTLSSNPTGFVRYGDRALFLALDPDQSRSLWTTDGTPGGTRRVVGNFRSGAHLPVVAGGKVYFQAETVGGPNTFSLWVTDGTAAGTRPLAPVAIGSPSNGYDDGQFVTPGGRVLFVGTDAAHGKELWTTDAAHPPARTSSTTSFPARTVA